MSPADRELVWKMDYERHSLIRKDMNNDQDFFTKYPEWFGYFVIGRDILSLASESGNFFGFMPFQIDFMRSWINPMIYKMFGICNRGGAKSWLEAYCAAYDCSINPRMGIPILGGSREQSDKPFQYARNLVGWPKEPPGTSVNSPYRKSGVRDLISYANDEVIMWKNGSFIENLAASSTSTRGGRAKKLVVDEITQLKETILSGYYGRAITSPNFKIICTGTPDDPTHRSYRWWCSPPYKGCHHWYNGDKNSKFHLFHWDAFDCLVDKGGWITHQTLEEMESLYDTHAEYRKEVLGLWTLTKGNIINWDDANSACENFWIKDLPDPSKLDGIIISVDGARNRHYSAVISTGYTKSRAFVYYAWGKENIREQDLRKRIVDLAIWYKSLGLKVYIVIENAPVSKTLIDNVQVECQEKGIGFTTSEFTNKKNKYIDHMVGYFENRRINIPHEFKNLINEIFMYKWADNGKPAKGNDDFVDSLDHNLFHDWLVMIRTNEIPTVVGYDRDPDNFDQIKPFKAAPPKWSEPVSKRYSGF